MTAAPDSLQQRYAAIERIYSERQWDDVAQRSEELLLDLPDDTNHPLRQRLQLLLGHTHLYGYRDTATAAGFYSWVRAATEEPILLDIASQGLQQCARGNAMPAMPWMEQLGRVDPVPDRMAPLDVTDCDALPAVVQELPTKPMKGLSPEERAELSKGLLRVVIR